MDIKQSEKLKKLVFDKITCDLSNTTFHPHGQEIWIINFDTKEWFFEYHNDGQLWYNQKLFSVYLPLFSLTNSENQKFIKYWFETSLKLTVNKIARKNSNMDYYIDGIINDKKYKWALNERYGFSYNTVKQYLDLKKKLSNKNLELKHFLNEIKVF